MHATLHDLVIVLDPPLNRRQLVTLIKLAGIPQTGVRHTGRRGQPLKTYALAQVQAAHAEEAARTVKGFTDSDWISAALIARDLIRVDPVPGAIWWPDGTRAETLHSTLYGWVHCGPVPVPAHRVVWIAADGEIPPAMQVNHINRLKWDNRRANLEIVSFGNNIRHAHGTPYTTYHDAVNQLAALEPAQPSVNPFSGHNFAGGRILAGPATH
jgi:hypothetical protein